MNRLANVLSIAMAQGIIAARQRTYRSILESAMRPLISTVLTYIGRTLRTERMAPKVEPLPSVARRDNGHLTCENLDEVRTNATASLLTFSIHP